MHMANYVVWLDSSVAKIFALHPGEFEETKLKRHELKHHNNTADKAQNNHKDLEKYFHQVATALEQAHEILLIGPGEAKTHFKQHLLNHHHTKIADKIVASETVDHPTDGQIVALAKKFFKKHLQFE
jgi:stalled ribosome rescue protein Dom34